MTANQIAYQNMLETRRANQAREHETERSNRANEKRIKPQNFRDIATGVNQIGDTTSDLAKIGRDTVTTLVPNIGRLLGSIL